MNKRNRRIVMGIGAILAFIASLLTLKLLECYAMKSEIITADNTAEIVEEQGTTNDFTSMNMDVEEEFVDRSINLSTEVMNYTDGIDVTSENFKYLGKYDITGYTPKCVHCCGNDKGITASGTVATRGRTVATYKNIPFGTTLYIKGYGFYKVEDRGAFKQDTIDIACISHDECYDITSSSIDVYIVNDDSFLVY